MRKFTFVTLLIAVVLFSYSCGNRKNAADYAGMIDSIRKAEVEKELLKPAEGDPVTVFFDSLSIKMVPMKYSEDFVTYLPQMTRVPSAMNARFGYENNIELYAAKLPSYQLFHMMLLAERLDSISTTLYLCTMNQENVLMDRLCIYEQKVEQKHETLRLTRLEYYITSQYETTLVKYFRDEDDETENEEAAYRYVINKEGNFEEVIIEL